MASSLAFKEQTSEILALCKPGLNVISKVLAVLQEDVDTQPTAPSLLPKRCESLHDLTTTLITELQNIRGSVTQLSEQYQSLIDIVHQVSMDLPTFLRDINLQHLQGNFGDMTTVQQLLKLENLEGEMTPVHRRRLEREVGKIRTRMESGAGLSEITPTLHRLQETILQLISSCLAKLKESISVSTDNKEESGKSWWVCNTFLGQWLYSKFQRLCSMYRRVYNTLLAWPLYSMFQRLCGMFLRSSNSEDTFTTRHRKIIEWIEQEQIDQLPTPGVKEVTPDLTELLLKNDLQTLSYFKASIAKTRNELLTVISSVGELEKQAMEIARSLRKHYELN